MLERTDRIKLAAKVGCDPKTVKKWLVDPMSVRRYFNEGLTEAARELGLELPWPTDDTEATG